MKTLTISSALPIFLIVLFHNLTRLWKSDLIENQSDLYKKYNIFDSKNYGLLTLIIQKV
ncbi:hypothetical protein J2Y02_004823 [Neobacillus drentensis]|nr:hypothetical protein [Neobacillus drentensis]